MSVFEADGTVSHTKWDVEIARLKAELDQAHEIGLDVMRERDTAQAQSDERMLIIVAHRKRIDALEADLAAARAGIAGRVWCMKCGATRKVDSGDCLRHGWPECCGETMTIDSPEEERRLSAPNAAHDGRGIPRTVDGIVGLSESMKGE